MNTKLLTSSLGLTMASFAFAACATLAPPPELVDVRARLNSPSLPALEADRADLVRDVRMHHENAERALEDQDAEATLWHARIAAQQLDIATDLSKRNQALAARDILIARDAELAKVEGELVDKRREVERMGALHSKVRQLEGQLVSAAAARDTDAARAKSSLLMARQRQAEAIGAGAASRAKDTYQQGRLLLEAAIESMSAELFKQGEATASRAAEAFVQAKAIAERAPVEPVVKAPAPKPEPTRVEVTVATEPPTPLPAKAVESAELKAQRAEARRAIEAAEDRRARVADRPTAQLTRGDYELDLARAAEAAYPVRARSKAEAAAQSYAALVAQASTVRPAATSSLAFAGAGAFDASSPASFRSSGYAARSLDTILLELEILRADLVLASRAEPCRSLVESSDRLAQIARQRRTLGDDARAYELAVRASERAKACERSAKPEGRSDVIAASATAAIPPDDGTAMRRAAETALARAEAALAGAEGDPAQRSLLGPAKTLLAKAERWYQRDRPTQAKSLAEASFAEVSAVQDQLATAAAAQERQADDAATKAAAAKKLASAAALKEAQAQLQQAQIEVAGAAGRAPEHPRLAESQTLVTAAAEWLRMNRADDSKTMSARAIQVAKTIKTPPRIAAKASAVVAAAPAPTKTSTRAQAQARIKAEQLMTLGALQSRARSLPAEQRLLADAIQGGLDAARVASANDDLARVDKLIDHLRGLLDRAEATDGKLAPTPAATPMIAASAKVEMPKEPLSDEARATRALMLDVQIALERARAIRSPEGVRMVQRARRFQDQALTAERASDHLAAQRYGEAARSEVQEALAVQRGELDQARTASAAASRARAVASRKAAETPPIPTKTAKAAVTASPEPTSTRAAAPAPTDVSVSVAAPEAKPAAAATQSPVVVAAAVPVTTGAAPAPVSDKEWTPIYTDITETLILRDRVRSVAGPEDTRRLTLADRYLERARRAWKQGRYESAGSLSQAASEELAGVEADIELRAQAKVESDKDAAAKAEADKRAKAAQAATQAEREAREAAEAKARRASATAEASKAEAADIAAADAREKKLEAERQADRQRDHQLLAADALREARVHKTVCEKRNCKDRDLEGWLRATGDLEAADKANAAADYVRAATLARSAMEQMDRIPQGPPPFVVPAHIDSVQLVGRKLQVTPRIEFASGKATFDSPDTAALEALAETIRANLPSLVSIEVSGFTDDRGSKQINLRISRARAEAVRDALLARGVPAGLVRAVGRGPDTPIADNATAEGRRANRRIEIRVDTKAITEPEGS